MKKIILSILLCCLFIGCSQALNVGKNVLGELSDIRNVQFKLGKANNFTLSTINISKLRSVSDVSVTDGLLLANAIRQKQLPTSFTLELIASNPNSKTQPKTNKSLEALVSSIAWVLYIDNKETVQGQVTTPMKIPTSSSPTIIPIAIGLDLFKFFGDKGYESIINLALAVGGVDGTTSRLQLKIRPTISIAGFPIEYPDYITVVNTEFRG